MPKVLVADDSMAVRKVAERHLTQAGLDVTLAASGEEAMALLAHERPDLIVCDVIMPDKSGYDVCTFTRSQAPLAKTPFLLISGIVNAEVTRQAEMCGANGVLKKPFQGNALQERALTLLGEPSQSGATQDTAFASSTATPPPREGNGSAALQKATAEIEQLRSALVREQEQTAQLRQQVSELESALASERDAAAQLVTQMKQPGKDGKSVRELHAQLEREREKAAQMGRRLAEIEQAAGRVEELETLLARECDQTARLTERLAGAQHGAGRVEELETLLATECERTAQLEQQLAHAQQKVAEADRREEELSRKLSQIANLSQ